MVLEDRGSSEWVSVTVLSGMYGGGAYLGRMGLLRSLWMADPHNSMPF